MPGVALSREEREEIRAGIERGSSCVEVARLLERAPSTVSREIRRNRGRLWYRAGTAELRAQGKRKRPKVPTLIADRQLARAVTIDLKAGYSPAGIAARLRATGGPTVSHETIYQALYATDFRGIRVLPAQCLRTRRRRRRRRGGRRTTGREKTFGQFKLIDSRPAAANERSEPGHWEGDLIVGPHMRSAVVTLVERVSRLTRLGHVPGRHTAEIVSNALVTAFADVNVVMRSSLTWDQGIEMTRWRFVEDETGMPVYFCHPHSAWERPSNEHTNRQLRFWLPKGTDLSRASQEDLDRIAFVLNTLPRRTLNWQTPQQVYDAYVSASTP
jgi:IS30 family transposase